MVERQLFLDQNEHLPLTLRIEDGKLHATLNLSYVQNPRFKQNIEDMLRVTFASGKEMELKPAGDGVYTLETELQGTGFDIRINGRDIMAFGAQDLSDAPMNAYGPLTNFECRMLGRANNEFLYKNVPFNRSTLYQLDNGLDDVRPRTELHTHLTSEITAENLIRIAEENNALYPAELLTDALGLEDVPIADDVKMKPIEFAPMSGKGLKCESAGDDLVDAVRIRDLNPEQRNALKRALEIPTDTVYTFDGLERKMYRFRNPFTKNDKLIGPIILKVAEQYAEQGIAYTEQSVTGALKPKWLKAAIPALEEAKEKYGVDMRFLVGIPRNFGPDRMLREIERLKFVSQSPHIAGVDFLGYESNKTENFSWALRRIAEYASNRPVRTRKDGSETTDFFLRVHAGETGKNLDNVMAAMKVANEYGIPLRIGHGIYVDMDEEFKTLAREMVRRDLITVEFNPDSNMANNNVDSPLDIPVQQWKDLGVPFVISSDGSGAYQTDTQQLITSMLAAGLHVEDLKEMREYEDRYIERMENAYAFRKQYSLDDKEFFNTYEGLALSQERSARKVKTQVIQEGERSLSTELNGKIPLLIAGASGSSWKNIDENDRIEIEIGVRMLTALLDPEKIFFCAGRVKDQGITHILDNAISNTDEAGNHSRKFHLLGLLSQLQHMVSLPKNLTDIWELHGGLMAVPTEMIDFIGEHDGMALFIGGGAFTRDFILNSEEKDISFGTMCGPEGASQEKCRVTEPEQQFSSALGMVKHVQAMAEEKETSVFEKDADLSEKGLEALYAKMRKDVLAEHGMDWAGRTKSGNGRG